MRALAVLIVLLLTTAAAPAPPAPYGTFHQHLISPAMAKLWEQPQFDAKDLIAQMDAGHMRKAAVLSVAYVWGDDRRNLPDADEKTRAENDWTDAQVARFPDRLIGFCSVNPLREAARAEAERCLKSPHMKGVKLHLGNSGVDLGKPDDVAHLRAIFAAAEAHHAPIVVHMRVRTTRPYGAAEARAFLDRVMPAAPTTMVQIAHLAGAGPGFQPDIDQAMGVFADAIAKNDPRVRNLWFDMATTVAADTPPAEVERVAARIRQVGAKRVLFGSDLSIGGNPPPGEAWAIFTARTPLTPVEFATIARNAPPYAR